MVNIRTLLITGLLMAMPAIVVCENTTNESSLGRSVENLLGSAIKKAVPEETAITMRKQSAAETQKQLEELRAKNGNAQTETTQEEPKLIINAFDKISPEKIAQIRALLQHRADIN